MWVEQRPEEGDTVKIEFADWTNLGIKIGVFLRYGGGKGIISFGDKLRYLDLNTNFMVFKK